LCHDKSAARALRKSCVILIYGDSVSSPVDIDCMMMQL
jgi:hypothetical protein